MDTQWAAWAARHAAVFGLSPERLAPSLAEWAAALARAGFTAAEAGAATDWLAANAPMRFSGEHLPALLDRLRAAREPAPGEGYDPGSCTLCGGTGRLSVPNPRSLARGRWTWLSVLCRCPLGRWYGTRQGGRRSLTLEEYEQGVPGLAGLEAGVPDWRERVLAHARLLEDRAFASGPLSPDLGRLLARLRARFGRGEGLR